MFNAAPGMHHEIARQHQQTLLDDARSLRQSERAPHRTGLRVTLVALVACLGVGAIGLSQAKAATTSRTAAQTATRTTAHANYRPPSRLSHRPTTRNSSRLTSRMAYRPACRLIGAAATKRALHQASRHAPRVVISRAL